MVILSLLGVLVLVVLGRMGLGLVVQSACKQQRWQLQEQSVRLLGWALELMLVSFHIRALY
jgi:hypothetical protein